MELSGFENTDFIPVICYISGMVLTAWSFGWRCLDMTSLMIGWALCQLYDFSFIFICSILSV